ncbi:MAG: hypothetical protein A2Y15_08645 [Clostridiales bacterium GWF2_36_10]|nr:MAG: hypothetical protein A2Y15_08645 [Clostridiales bacterium GWF2_36_10]HAN20411.1 hypothetical protein [Clostridiales bacterium]
MRCQYREQIYKCGNYLDVQIYPVFNQQVGRRKKAKPTSQIQERLNQINAENAFVRLVHNNFIVDDLALDLTYADKYLPETLEYAEKLLHNFLRRLKRYRKKYNLPDLKYVCVTEASGCRVHHHLIVNGGIDRDILEQLWGIGYANSQRLQFDEEGITDKVRYITKNSRSEKKPLNKKRWTSSKNLIKPKAQERTGKISKQQAKELAADTTTQLEQAAYFEDLYPGYFFASVAPYHNLINNEFYFHVKMYRKEYIKRKRK